MAYEALGKLEKAMTCYTQALELSSKDPQLWLNKGVCLATLEKPRYEEAIHCFSKAIEFDPKYTAALNNMVLSRIRKKRRSARYYRLLFADISEYCRFHTL